LDGQSRATVFLFLFLFGFFPQFFGLVAVYQSNLHVPINPLPSQPGTGF
jgi:hypothetical protein